MWFSAKATTDNTGRSKRGTIQEGIDKEGPNKTGGNYY